MSSNGAVRWPQCYELAKSEVRALKCSFLDELPDGVTLTGPPTADEIGTNDLTIGAAALNAAEMDVDGDAHPANTVVIFTVTGALPREPYEIRVSCGTTGSPAETMVGIAECVGVDDGT